ncbi:uncharacterized protein LOC111074260 [Drosophila obscura]|uniref:uncharacterized protein LOC111074260 n=1 Tax=Drosophila obscura TaxID=7282 RepID=UPI000BA17F1A|nr:uncharacterized protein LOC111074260 [Drosophila obscura]
MPSILKKLPSMCSSMRPVVTLYLRSYSGNSSMPNAGINRAMMNLGFGTRQWPKREDWFAARQIMVQKQNQNLNQNRYWSNSSINLDKPTRRRRRQFGGSQDLPAHTIGEFDTEVRAHKREQHRQAAGWMEEVDRNEQAEDDWMARASAAEQHEQRFSNQDRRAQALVAERYEMEGANDDQRVGTVREVVFGQKQDDIEDEDELERKQYSDELFRRVSAQRTDYNTPRKAISRKVICPYPSYSSHRSRWAEFRHAMIYGRTTF